jgi:tetratricopeptide (TPR) repeat protein
MAERYTRNEAERIVGVTGRQLRYWERLHLLHPSTRWGERFYSFSDLVAIETIKRLTDRRVPARRLRRAIAALERELGTAPLPLEELQIQASGRQVAVLPPGRDTHPIEPLTGQFLMRFDTQELAHKVHRMVSRTAEEWFEFALACDSRPETIPEAISAYRHVLELAPSWVEAHINLGVALYQLSELEEARQAFLNALVLDPQNSITHFNLGCVLDELGRPDESIKHLEEAVRIAPDHADAHFNLALAYEKRRERRRARDHWALYLRYEPRGPWSDYARSRLEPPRPARSLPAPIPFRKKG